MRWKARDPDRWRHRFLWLPRRFGTGSWRWLEWYMVRPIDGPRRPMSLWPSLWWELVLSGDDIVYRETRAVPGAAGLFATAYWSPAEYLKAVADAKASQGALGCPPPPFRVAADCM